MASEALRQGVHLVSSLLLAVLASFVDAVLFALVCAVLVFALAALLAVRGPARRALLRYFEREHHKKTFPGKGGFALLLGALLTALLFPEHVVAAVLVVGVADVASTLLGMRFGEKRVPWTARKSWVGVASFFVSASAVLFFFSSWWALVALLATGVEAVDYHDVLFLDDNLVVPLVVGAALVLV